MALEVIGQWLDAARDRADLLTKAHVRSHTMRTKSGRMVQVKEHEDSRQRRVEGPHRQAGSAAWDDARDRGAAEVGDFNVRQRAREEAARGKAPGGRRLPDPAGQARAKAALAAAKPIGGERPDHQVGPVPKKGTVQDEIAHHASHLDRLHEALRTVRQPGRGTKEMIDRFHAEAMKHHEAIVALNHEHHGAANWSAQNPGPNGELTPHDTPHILKLRKEARENLTKGDTMDIDTPERHAKREEVVQAILNKYPNVKQERKAFIIMGPPAAGKSTVANPLATEHGARIVDNDDAKAELDEFKGGEGAGVVHRESATIADMATDRAIANGDNIILPKIGKTVDGPGGLDEHVKHLKSKGYQVHLIHVGLDKHTTTKRAISRMYKTGRFVDPDYVYNSVDSKTEPAHAKMLEKGGADSYERYDTSGLGGARLIEARDATGKPKGAGLLGGGGSDLNKGAVRSGRFGHAAQGHRRATGRVRGDADTLSSDSLLAKSLYWEAIVQDLQLEKSVSLAKLRVRTKDGTAEDPLDDRRGGFATEAPARVKLKGKPRCTCRADGRLPNAPGKETISTADPDPLEPGCPLHSPKRGTPKPGKPSKPATPHNEQRPKAPGKEQIATRDHTAEDALRNKSPRSLAAQYQRKREP